MAAGATYYFKIKAKNKWGWGDFSTPASILAATVPDTMGSVTTSIDAASGGVQLAWDAPGGTGGVPITSYLIEIQSSDNSWSSDSNCDGSTQSIVDARTCIIPMATLVASPHSLAFDVLVVVRASASNSRGAGPTGPDNTAGARIR